MDRHKLTKDLDRPARIFRAEARIVSARLRPGAVSQEASEIPQDPIRAKGDSDLGEQREALSRPAARALDARPVGKSAEHPVPDNHPAAVVRVALVEIARVMELVHLGCSEDPAKDAGTKWQVGVIKEGGDRCEHEHHTDDIITRS